MGDGYYDDMSGYYDDEEIGLGYAMNAPRGGIHRLETQSPGVTGGITSSGGWYAPNTVAWSDPSYGMISVPRGGIRFPSAEKIEEERQKMRDTDDLIAEAENLRQQAERLEQIAEQRGRYGADPFKNGVVLKVDMKYRDTNRTYAYAVVKTAGRYWLSGRLIPQAGVTLVPVAAGWSWDQFVAWLAQGDATVWRARGLEQVL